MVKRLVSMALMSAVLIAGMVSAAHAVLQRVGPVNNAASVGGYPAWYQDTTGLALEFCDPKNQAEVDGGWCLLLTADVAVPEVFPTNFFDEHFWYSTGAVFPASPVGLLWEAAVEAAFATAVQPGDQITFSRIRMRLDPVPVTGTYRFIHPYGEEVVDADGGDRIFITDDVGINCPPGGPFNCALESRLGPYLLPSNTPGGAELPPVSGPVPGKLYIADPAREGPVTGSPLGPTRNFVRVEGPAGSNLDGQGNNFIETTNFTLVGRIFQGAIPSALTIDRASYAAAAGTGNKVDVFATAFPATQARLPAGTAPAVITPQLLFYEAACGVNAAGDLIAPPAGTASHTMASPGLMIPSQAAPDSIYWGQSQPPLIPLAVCVEHQNAVNAQGQIVPVFFHANVTDQVFITAANYDPANGGSLSVIASSSDEINTPTLTLGGFGDLVNGQFILAPLTAPPAKVRVLSSFGGSNEFQVTTAVGAPGGGGLVAASDAVTIAEDAAPTPIGVLANDTLPAGTPVLNIISLPGLGTAVVNGAAIDYTPNANANGTDGFTYSVTVGAASSNIAAVTITITPVNDPPVAANDGFVAIAGVQTQLNVLANDTDADGQADLVAAVNVTQPIPAGATVTVVNGLPLFTATAAGTFTFTYQARDAAGVTSANTATVTVTVAGAETVTIQVAEFRTTNREWRVSGVVTPTTSGTVTIRYANGPNADLVIGTAAIGAGGAWSFRETGVTGLRDPRTGQASQIRATGPAGGSATGTFLLRR
jgi:hypothetical protein